MAPQTIRFGRYELETRLGVGGMAEVWLARQVGPGGFTKRAVIKRILPGLAGDPEFVEMFLQEARLAALLNHPNAVQIFDLGEVDDSYFLVMEYIEGRSLRFLEKQSDELGKALELGFVAFVLAGACSGLHHAHEQHGLGGERLGLVHRDVAPDNLLVSYEGITKVIDFGIAKAFAEVDQTKSGVVKGKYGYMSPEQVRGDSIDRRSDVYAMGVVLFEALGGLRPFNGSPTEILHAILEDSPPRLDQLRPDLAPTICDLVQSMLQKNPSQRPQDIREVEQVLLAIAQREGWGQTEVARVVRILGGVWKETAAPMPAASPPTRAARGQFDEGPRSTEPFLPVAEPTRTQEMESLPLPGAGTIDASGRVQLNAARESFAPPPEQVALEVIEHKAAKASTLPLELAYERTELADAPAPISMPPTPAMELRGNNVFSSVIRVALVLMVLGVAWVGLKRWLARRDLPTTVRLTIESRPSGSEIWLDGLPTGKYTPSVLDWDNQIAHVVLLKAEGRANTSETIPAGQTEGSVAIDLAAVGRVRVATDPAGAKIASGTEDLGTSPRAIELPADAPAKLTASLDGYLEASTTLTVVAGATIDWAPSLSPAGQLQIESDPSDAKVRLDGQAVGRTPLVLTVTAATAHLIQLDAPGLDPYKISVAVEMRGTKKVSAHLADREEHRLQAQLASTNRQLDELNRELQGLDANTSTEFFATMAGLKKRTAMEAKLDKLSKRKDELEGQIDAHRTELEDRSTK